jgi:two-component system sensor histidine kinase PilS (NtrC family)
MMFQPFSSSSGGTGIGLAIVYRIVQEHGGAIHVRSKEGAGTSLTVSIPDKIGVKDDFKITVEKADP